ncbi:hypothetical protein ANCCEY_04571 [Ancylostoma ceylanicum]|uniref:COMPASS complex Set1 subunit N-SET domain-containing protein n=1 Tax=Ancylostoma ceylanicum TaxID=53326 RepID=A0A0D6LX30_9BILA|nr:hypothetical protein ANCCEY_04571 [Ancylostoma ceylanicum]
MFELNDNVNKAFLKQLANKVAPPIDLDVFYHPTTKKHMGMAMIVFPTFQGTSDAEVRGTISSEEVPCRNTWNNSEYYNSYMGAFNMNNYFYNLPSPTWPAHNNLQITNSFAPSAASYCLPQPNQESQRSGAENRHGYAGFDPDRPDSRRLNRGYASCDSEPCPRNYYRSPRQDHSRSEGYARGSGRYPVERTWESRRRYRRVFLSERRRGRNSRTREFYRKDGYVVRRYHYRGSSPDYSSRERHGDFNNNDSEALESLALPPPRKKSRWDEGEVSEKPSPSPRKKSRWDDPGDADFSSSQSQPGPSGAAIPPMPPIPPIFGMAYPPPPPYSAMPSEGSVAFPPGHSSDTSSTSSSSSSLNIGEYLRVEKKEMSTKYISREREGREKTIVEEIKTITKRKKYMVTESKRNDLKQTPGLQKISSDESEERREFPKVALRFVEDSLPHKPTSSGPSQLTLADRVASIFGADTLGEPSTSTKGARPGSSASQRQGSDEAVYDDVDDMDVDVGSSISPPPEDSMKNGRGQRRTRRKTADRQRRQFAKNVAVVCEATEKTIGEEIVDVVTKDFYKRVEGVSFEILEEVLAELRHELEEQKRNEAQEALRAQAQMVTPEKPSDVAQFCSPLAASLSATPEKLGAFPFTINMPKLPSFRRKVRPPSPESESESRSPFVRKRGDESDDSDAAQKSSSSSPSPSSSESSDEVVLRRKKQTQRYRSESVSGSVFDQNHRVNSPPASSNLVRALHLLHPSLIEVTIKDKNEKVVAPQKQVKPRADRELLGLFPRESRPPPKPQCCFDPEDQEYLKQAWLQLQPSGENAPPAPWVRPLRFNFASWADKPRLLDKPVKRGRVDQYFADPELDGILPIEDGCARTRGYFKMSAKEKRSLIRRPEDEQRDRTVISERDEAAVRHNLVVTKESRSMHRRLLTTMGDTNTDFFKYRKKMIKFARSRIHGWGLYAMEAIAPDDMIVEYVGQKVRNTVADVREKAYERRGIGSSYLFRIDDTTGFCFKAQLSNGLLIAYL